jgi:adenylate cyclase
VPVPAVERKLAAIFAAHIAGYSRLMGLDEAGTFVQLKACRTVMDRLIAAHRGRIFNTAGDTSSPILRARSMPCNALLQSRRLSVGKMRAWPKSRQCISASAFMSAT